LQRETTHGRVGTWDDPPVYGIVPRDEHRIHFRLADPPKPNPTNTPTSSANRRITSITQAAFPNTRKKKRAKRAWC